MSDQPENEETPESMQDFLNNLLGGEKGTEEFFSQLEVDPLAEAFTGFHELFLALRSGGFSTFEALHILGVYLATLIPGTESS